MSRISYKLQHTFIHFTIEQLYLLIDHSMLIAAAFPPDPGGSEGGVRQISGSPVGGVWTILRDVVEESPISAVLQLRDSIFLMMQEMTVMEARPAAAK